MFKNPATTLQFLLLFPLQICLGLLLVEGGGLLFTAIKLTKHTSVSWFPLCLSVCMLAGVTFPFDIFDLSVKKLLV